jgi:hypothetical protein
MRDRYAASARADATGWQSPGRKYLDRGRFFWEVAAGADGQIRRSWLFRYAVSLESYQQGRQSPPTRTLGRVLGRSPM